MLSTRTEDLIKNKEYIVMKVIYAFITALFLPFLGSIILFYRAHVNKRRETITLFKKLNFSIEADKRFKSGFRKNYNKKSSAPVVVKMNSKEKELANLKANLYIIIGIVFILSYLTLLLINKFKV